MTRSRRRFTMALGATVGTIAGCSTLVEQSNETADPARPDNSPGDPIVALYRAIESGDQQAVEGTLHSKSPGEPSVVNSYDDETEILVEDTSVRTDGPSESQIRDAVGEKWDDEDLQQIVDAATGADNSAIVEAEVEFFEDGASGVIRQQSIVATENGSYKLLG